MDGRIMRCGTTTVATSEIRQRREQTSSQQSVTFNLRIDYTVNFSFTRGSHCVPCTITLSSAVRRRGSEAAWTFSCGRVPPGGLGTMTLAHWWTCSVRARPTDDGVCSRRPQRRIADQQRENSLRRSCCNTRNSTFTRHSLIWYSEEGPGRGRSPPRPLLAVPNVTAHRSTASLPISVLLYDGPLLCGVNVAIKWLIGLFIMLTATLTKSSNRNLVRIHRVSKKDVTFILH